VPQLESNRDTLNSLLDIEDPLVQPDVVLPVQFHDLRRSNVQFDPIRRLMVAVLTNAVGCFQRYLGAQGRSRARLFEEAEEWLFRAGGDGLFSFENVCDALEIDMNRLRRSLLNWHARKLAGEAPRPVTRRSAGVARALATRAQG